MPLGMSTLDLIILVICAAAAIYGGKEGILHYITVILSFVLTFALYPAANAFAVNFDFFENNLLWKILLFLVLFIVVSMVLRIFASIIRDILKMLFVGWLNNLLGAIFATLIASFVIYFGSVLVHKIGSVPWHDIAAQSQILQFLNGIYGEILNFDLLSPQEIMSKLKGGGFESGIKSMIDALPDDLSSNEAAKLLDKLPKDIDQETINELMEKLPESFDKSSFE